MKTALRYHYIKILTINLQYYKTCTLNIFHSINDFRSTKETILTLGTFDGVHIGHKKILDKVINSTENGEYESLVLTFFPHPRMVLQENSEIKLLNTITEKIELLENMGIHNLVIHPFDETFSRLTAEDFVQTVLVEKFNIQKIIIGYDHRFGRNRTANIDDLIEYGIKYGFEVEQISVKEIDDISVSSTKIRTALSEGDMAKANNYLDYNYSLSGTVFQGKQLGRTIGFPTANIKIEEDYKLVPKKGAYIVTSTIDNNVLKGIMNIGLNPTVQGENLSIEIHFLDFDQDLYGKKITVTLLKYLRPEQKFDSLNELTTQLERDKATAIEYFNNC
tara:strand:- start:1869 stop:2870 length:1002 start_codon:yes stop_codon:yes gene_type:complete